MKRHKSFSLAVLLILSLLILPSSGYAQSDVDESVSMSNGEKKRIVINDAPDEYIIRVYKKDGSWEGQEITARGRNISSSSYCHFELFIMGVGGYYFGGTVINSNEWSHWADNPQDGAPSVYGKGSSSDTYFDIHLKISDECYSYYDDGDVEIEIWLVESEPPPTEPPTQPPTEPPTEAPTAPPTQVDFWADDYQIEAGECTQLHWGVENGTVYWNGEETYNYAFIDVCPEVTTSYKIEVYGEDGQWHDQELTIYVEEAPPPPPPAITEINYWADKYEVNSGECTMLYWEINNAEKVVWDVWDTGSIAKVEVCPQQTTSYKLKITGKNGQQYERELTIEVNTNCEYDPYGRILIVTDSRKLNQVTNDTNAWSTIKSLLSEYYKSGAVKCAGMPVFLDMADHYPGGYVSANVQEKILEIVEKYGFSKPGQPPLGAIAIIGGPKVIPYIELPDPTGQEPQIYSDNYYAHLHLDSWEETVVTRLPDGNSTDLMVNYITFLASGRKPPEGGVILAPIQSSAHRLNFRPDYVSTIRYDYDGPLFPSDDDLLNIDDVLKARAGSISYLIAPIWSSQLYNPQAVDNSLIRLDDFINSMGLPDNQGGVGSQLIKRDILFFNLNADSESNWYAQDVRRGSSSINIYNSNSARDIPAGAQIFALVPHSADLMFGNRQPENTISLRLLEQGAHHFIGLTGSLYYVGKNPHPYNDVPNQIYDISIFNFSPAFAQYYYRTYSQDPLGAYWMARVEYFKQHGVGNPVDYKIYNSFVYYGLPEKGPQPGVYQSVRLDPLPQPEYTPLPSTKSCPSGDRSDCDGDSIPDQTEHDLVEKFKPYVQFHPNDQALTSGRTPPYDVYWQVSPAKLNEVKGAFLTIVMTYRDDYGMDDLEIEGWEDNLSCYGLSTAIACAAFSCWAGPLAVISVDMAGEVSDSTYDTLLGHAGDTEPVRFFLACNQGDCSNVHNWTLTHIDWRRHAVEGFGDPGDPIPISESMEEEGLVIRENHPVLYISLNKHALYPSMDDCEGYKYNLFASCDANFEKCSDDQAYRLLPFTPPEFNVGEFERTFDVFQIGNVQTTYHLLDELPGFSSEYAWRGNILKGEGDKEFFCGGRGKTDTFMDEPCGGALTSKWFDPLNNPYENK